MSYMRKVAELLISDYEANHQWVSVGSLIQARDDKIAELEALLEKADKMHDERLYELQQLQKRYIPNWEQQVEARIEAGTRRLHGEGTANNGA